MTLASRPGRRGVSSAGHCPGVHDHAAGGRGHQVEGAAVATDVEFVYQGAIDIASIKIWLRHPTHQDPADTP